MIKIKIVKANFGLRIFIFPYNISMKHLNIHIDFFERNGEKILGTINRIINENERIALIGPNGAGKSTFMKIISGQITDFEGNIEKELTIEEKKMEETGEFERYTELVERYTLLG